MSRWQLPTQKGTELWPSATRSPLKIRFDGVPPGSELARELFGLFQGEISRFYSKAAQAYSLSNSDQQMMHQRDDDLALRYQNSQGHETLHVTVKAGAAQRRRKVLPVDVWDWALVEIMIDETAFGTTLTGLAEMRVPVLETITPDSALPWVGVTRGGVVSGETATGERVLFSPPTSPLAQTRSTPEQRASFLIDLRPMRGIPIVAVDLYAAVTALAENLPSYGRSYAVSTGGISATGLPAPLGTAGDMPNPVRFFSTPWPPTSFGDLLSWTGAEDAGPVPFPPFEFNRETLIWDFGSATYETVGYSTGTIAAFTVDTFALPGALFPWFVFAVGSNPSSYEAGGPREVPGQISGRVFKGGPDLVVSRERTALSVDTYRWRDRIDLSRPTLTDIGNATITLKGASETLFGRFGYPRLGRVFIDTRTGGISFAAA